MSINQPGIKGASKVFILSGKEAPDEGHSGSSIKRWRERRHLSQKDLATAAGVSSRHISFIETGRSKPSRKMVLRLCEVLDLPYRSRNAVLSASKYAPAFGETSLAAKEFDAVSRTLDVMLGRNEPNPSVVLDGDWNVIRTNEAGRKLLAFLLGGETVVMQGERNLIRWLVDEPDLRDAITNWNEVVVEIIRRLHRKIEANGADRKFQTLLDDLIGTFEPGLRNGPGTIDRSEASDMAVPISIKKSGMKMTFFATTTKFSAPRDIGLQELRVETLHPACKDTEEALRFLQISQL